MPLDGGELEQIRPRREEEERRHTREAEERGRRQQAVDSRLDGHEDRLQAINGSIESFRREQGKIKEGLAAVIHEVKTTKAVSEALQRNQISRREFWLATGMLAAVLLGVIITALRL